MRSIFQQPGDSSSITSIIHIMNFALIAILSLALIATATQTSALETLEAKQDEGIFAGADDFTGSAALQKGKSTKAPTTLSPTGPTPAANRKVKKGKSGKATIAPTPAPLIPGFVISGTDPSFTVVSCDPSSVEVAGSRTAEIKTGNILIYTPHATDTCTSCNPLFRKVQSISISSVTGNLILATTFLRVSEILQVGTANPDEIALGNEIMETLFDCLHSGQTSFINAATNEESITVLDEEHTVVVYDKLPPPPLSFVPWSENLSILAGTCNANWLKKNTDGRCTHTNCYVGVNGDPTDCFECGRMLTPDQNGCDNGCGTSGFTTDGKFDTFDFGPACCNHDHCYSSNSFTREQCDQTFLNEMKSQCPPPTKIVFFWRFPVEVINQDYLDCDAAANLFYGIVGKTFVGTLAYNSAQTKQQAHELNNVCIAKCPTTQESGGQGTTVLNIDMLRTSGTFQVDYQMYVIQDQLTIKYQGNTIFDTGGLVSGGGTASVSFSGTSSIITVIINAPEVGTAWDVYVGCPS